MYDGYGGRGCSCSMTKTPEMCGEDDGVGDEKRQNGEANPLELFSESIGIVQQIH